MSHGKCRSCRSGDAALAQNSADSAWRCKIGIGVSAQQSPFQSDGEKAQTDPFPWFSIESRWLSIDPAGLAIGMLRHDHLQVDALLAPRWLNSDPADNENLKDIDRNTGFDAGIRVATTIDRNTGTLDLKSDVSNTSKGAEASLDLATGFNLTPRVAVGIKAGVTWRDSDSSTYLFGLLSAEARADRARFALDSTLTPSAGLVVTYDLAPIMSLMLATEAEFLPDDVIDSPIVEQDVAMSSFVSVLYEF